MARRLDRPPDLLSQGPGEAGPEIKNKGAIEDEQQQQRQGGGSTIDDLHVVII